MTTEEMTEYADSLGLEVYNAKLTNKKAFSVQGSVIVIDESKIESDREYREVFSEEIGHCATNAFYPLSSCNDSLMRMNAEKQEKRAKDYSCRLQVPFCQLKRLLVCGYTDYEISERLDICLDTLILAVGYYREKGLLLAA